MINEFNLAKALKDRLTIAGTALSVDVKSTTDGYDPATNESLFVEHLMNGNNTPIGLQNATKDLQYGIYQVNVKTPISGNNKWSCLKLRDDLASYFPRGLTLESGGQSVLIRFVDSSDIMPDDTHFNIYLSINYSIIA